MTTETPTKEGRPREVFRLSLTTVARIHRWRMQYIAVYLAWLAFQLYGYYYVANANALPHPALLAVATLGLVFFYVRFIGVLRAMRYPAAMYLPAAALAIFPIPGVLVVAYVDRTIAKAIRKGMERLEADQAGEPEPDKG